MERTRRYFMRTCLERNILDELEDKITSFFGCNSIVFNTIPVDIFRIASLVGFDVRGTEFNDKYIDGLVLVDERIPVIDGFSSNKVIAYNCARDIDDKKFIVAHELAHYIQEKVDNPNTQILFAERDRSGEYSSEEQKTDYIAAALLVPKERLIADCKNSNPRSELFVKKMSKKYNVKAELIKRRIEEIL